MSSRRATSPYDGNSNISPGALPLLREPLGEFDENTAVGRILDLSKGDDEPQPFDDIQVDLIIPKQLQQLVAGMIGIFNIHNASSGKE